MAALGVGDIAQRAFVQALQFVQPGGWAAFNIKTTFLDPSDTTVFSTLVRERLFSEVIEVHHLERDGHRLSMEGNPQAWFALVLRKREALSQELLERVGLAS